MEKRVRSIKLIYEDGLIEDIKEGIVVIKEDDNMSFTAVNIDPMEQMLLSAITFHSLFTEYLREDGENVASADVIDNVLVDFIKVLLQVKYKNETKGDVLQ